MAKFKPPSISLVRTKIAKFKYGSEELPVIFPLCCTGPLWFSVLNALFMLASVEQITSFPFTSKNMDLLMYPLEFIN